MKDVDYEIEMDKKILWRNETITNSIYNITKPLNILDMKNMLWLRAKGWHWNDVILNKQQLKL